MWEIQQQSNAFVNILLHELQQSAVKCCHCHVQCFSISKSKIHALSFHRHYKIEQLQRYFSFEYVWIQKLSHRKHFKDEIEWRFFSVWLVCLYAMCVCVHCADKTAKLKWNIFRRAACSDWWWQMKLNLWCNC